MTDFSEKVVAGAAYLDVADPGWAERIVVDNLDLGSGSHCVIGQTMGSYFDGLNKLNLTDHQGIALGFNTPLSSEYEALTAEWIPHIEERQPDPVLPDPVPVRHEIESNFSVKYVVTTDDGGRTPRLVREGQGDVDQTVLIGTSRTSLWRDIGRAFIKLADAKDAGESLLVQPDTSSAGYSIGD
jgi:hypothetical protein